MKGRACDSCRTLHATCSLGSKYCISIFLQFLLTKYIAIRRPRKGKGKPLNHTKVKLEPVSPRAAKPKRKLEVYLGSDDEDLEQDIVSIDSQVTNGPKVTKGARGKQSKTSGSRGPTDTSAATRKSTRLNAGPDNLAKKARTTNTSQSESLFRRLAAEFAIIGRTCEEIADSVAL